jgi:hypothetical protein
MEATRSWRDILDTSIGPPGSKERIKFDKECERLACKDRWLDRIFGWMKRVPLRQRLKVNENGWPENYWYGLGPLMYLFWRTLADERSMWGTLDMLAFHYFDDKWVPTLTEVRKRKR